MKRKPQNCSKNYILYHCTKNVYREALSDLRAKFFWESMPPDPPPQMVE